jgi:DNA polymerase alpha subunit B
MRIKPDILIMPSKLACSAVEKEGTLLINPGSLTKFHTGGSYADITIHPIPERDLRDAVKVGKEEYEHNVFQRTVVNITNI